MANDCKKFDVKFQISRCEVKADEPNFAYFEGYASTFGNIDRTEDVVMPGAFAKTIKAHNGTMPMLWQHRWDEVIGKFVSMREDARGLFVEGRINLGTERGKEAYALLKATDLNTMSIGYQTLDYEFDKQVGVRFLKELELYEISLVTIPANEQAVVTGVKGKVPQAEVRLMGASDQEWAPDLAAARVAEAGLEEVAYLWMDGDEKKFLWGDIVGGKFLVSPDAAEAIAQEITDKDPQELGLVKADVIAIRTQLAKYFTAAGKVAPWRVKAVKELDTIADVTALLRSKGFSNQEVKVLVSKIKSFSSAHDVSEDGTKGQPQDAKLDSAAIVKSLNEIVKRLKE